MAENRFCSNCGTPLQPGARFCPSCGSPVASAPIAAPPPAYGPPPVYPQQTAYPQQSAPAYPPPPPAAYQQPYARPVRRRRGLGLMTVLGLVVGGILLLLLLARTAALNTVGVVTLATVTNVELTGGDDYEYRVQYSFTAKDGSAQTGAEILSDVTDVTTLPQEGELVKIRYLPFLPSVSSIYKSE